MTKLGDDYCPREIHTIESMPLICQWTLSVLNKAIWKTISAFESYKFSDASTVLYSWWQYQFCDVFIEAVKPYFENLSEFEYAREASRDTLWIIFMLTWISLDTGLRLLHPVMPFITEELWQRLPRAEGKKESIMISEYPSVVEAWTNEGIEEDLEIVNAAVRKFRSLRPQCNENRRFPAFALCRGHHIANIMKTYEFEITTLASVSSLKVLVENDMAPAGCAEDIVNKNLTVYLKLEGTLDTET
ncbi:unnamed protein product, partial [Musa acuminata var. zebrina]